MPAGSPRRESPRPEPTSTVPPELLLAAGDIALAGVRWVELRQKVHGRRRGRLVKTDVWQAHRDAEARLIRAIRKLADIKPTDCASPPKTSGNNSSPLSPVSAGPGAAPDQGGTFYCVACKDTGCSECEGQRVEADSSSALPKKGGSE